MKKTKLEKGITLIALIITIVVLLILAVVSIGAIRDSKIIGHSKDASSEYTIAQEKETLQLALSEWQLQKNVKSNTKTFKSTIGDALNDEATVGDDDPDDGPLTVTFIKTGKKYNVTNSGEITVEDGTESDVSGMYYTANGAIYELTKEGKFIGHFGSETQEMGAYEYDKSTKIITALGMEFTYIANGKDKLLVNYSNTSEDSQSMYLFTTGGFDSLKKPENGTYTGTYNNTSYTVEVSIDINNEKLTYSKNAENAENAENDGEDIGCIIIYDGVIYVYDTESGLFNSLFKISSDGDTLTGYGKYTGAEFTKNS